MNRASVNVYGRCKCLLFGLDRGAGGPPASAGILMSLGWSSRQEKFSVAPPPICRSSVSILKRDPLLFYMCLSIAVTVLASSWAARYFISVLYRAGCFTAHPYQHNIPQM